AEQKETAIERGMNRFQWNLRYPDATEVTGFWVPIAAGGLPDEVSGPAVVPGTYDVVLDYGGQRSQQSFKVALDPSIPTSQSDLEARFALQMQIHQALDELDRAINEAIAARDRLRGAGNTAAAAALDKTINSLVQLDVHSSEGTLLYETKLRSHLAYLQAESDLAYAKPTPAEYQVFEQLDRQAKAGEQALRAAGGVR
ncbi:MAG TPA: hypothetical protein VL284_02965, partial [Thermoanaerobaculia bacterium]|nr:hypothetical protein [Thermoanaerobaculia bacterium]